MQTATAIETFEKELLGLYGCHIADYCDAVCKTQEKAAAKDKNHILPDAISVKEFLATLVKKMGPLFSKAYNDKSILAKILRTDEMCKLDFDGKRCDHGQKDKLVCVKKLLALGGLYTMWRRKDSSNAFFK